MRYVLTVLILIAVALPMRAGAVSSQLHDFRVTTVIEGLRNPWSLAFLPAGGMLITERPGRMLLIARPGAKPQAVFGLPEIAARGQGGLLDVVPHPYHARNRLIYFTYSAGGDDGYATHLARARLIGSELKDLEVLLVARPFGYGGRHFGSRLAFLNDGTLLMTSGERGDMDRAQQLDDLAGKTLRLRDDGSVSADNPFARRPGARPEIYSYGHRNPQGLAVDRATGRIWLHEHGPRGGDEVNIVRPAVNYGWPVITHGIDYSGEKIGIGSRKAGMAQPSWVWVPSIAPSGMAFYDGDKFPKWRGNLFVGALAGRLLARLTLEGERVVAEERLLTGKLGRIRDVRQGPDGLLYLLTDAGNGRLIRLEPAE